MSNWPFRVAYEGTNFHGWQRQPRVRTVQGEMEAALAGLYGCEVLADGCSRTDAGVHALDQCVTVRPPERPRIPLAGAIKAINGRLPQDVNIRSAVEVADDFHARSKSVGKRYTYLLYRGNPQPFLARWCWRQSGRLDVEAMREAALGLVGTHDFSSFTVTGGDPGVDPVKTIHRIDLIEHESIVAISFVGNAFLYKMVRRLTGFLVEVGLGRLTPEVGGQLLTENTREVPFYTASAHGLFLQRVLYDEAELQAEPPSTLPFLTL